MFVTTFTVWKPMYAKFFSGHHHQSGSNCMKMKPNLAANFGSERRLCRRPYTRMAV